MKKKGFTIVELLAVIIILSIISLIIVPKIGDVIKNARKATARNSVHGYIDAINNKLASNIVNDEVMDGIISVRDLESEIEYRGTRVDGGIVTINNNKIAEAKLCVGGYSFRYYNGEVDNSDTNYCIDKSNIEIAILGAKTTQKLSNQFSIDVDLSNSDISSVTNIVCNNNAKPSIVNGELHVDNVYGDTKCSMESSIATTLSNLDNTVNNIVMIDDETVSSTLTIGEGKNVVLDLNGKTISSNSNTISNMGYLTIDSKKEGGIIETTGNNTKTISSSGETSKLLIKNGYIKNSHDCSVWSCSPIYVVNGGKLEITPSVDTSFENNIYSDGVYIESNFGIAVWVASNSTGEINGGTYKTIKTVDQNPWQHLVCSSCDALTINDANVIGDGASIRGQNSGHIIVNGGNYLSNYSNNIATDPAATINIDINGGTFLIPSGNTNASVRHNGVGTIEITGGSYISNANFTIYNISTGNINIHQTDTPIYVSSLAQSWKPAIANASTGIIDIVANKANACTANAGDTTSGLCVYVDGGGDYTSNSANGAVTNIYNGTVTSEQAIINIDGGTYRGGYVGIINQYSGTVNIADADVVSKNIAVRNTKNGTVNITGGTYISDNSTINNNSSGTINITQTDKPIYISTLSQTWKPAISNSSSGTINIKANQANACTANSSDTTSGLCVYAEANGDTEATSGNGAVQNVTTGNIVIDGGTYFGLTTGINNNSTGTISIANAKINSYRYSVYNGDGQVDIDNCNITSVNVPAVTNAKTGVVNITSGVYIGTKNSAISNSSTGTINITQTDKPIYIASRAQIWKPAIANGNQSVAYINIKANQANACTNNASDTTSGLCVYAEGDKNYASNTANSALQNSKGIVTIDGGTYYGGNQGLNNGNTGTLNIKNAKVLSSRYAVLNNTTGVVNVCNSIVNGDSRDLTNSSTGTINYNNITFSNGTTTPDSDNLSNPNGGTTNSVSTCPITE